MLSQDLIQWIHSFKSPDCILFDWRSDLSDGKVENCIVEELTQSETEQFRRWTRTLEQRAHNFTLIFLKIKDRGDIFPLTHLPQSLTAHDACLSLANVFNLSHQMHSLSLSLG